MEFSIFNLVYSCKILDKLTTKIREVFLSNIYHTNYNAYVSFISVCFLFQDI